MVKKILFCAEDYGSIKSLFPIFVYLSQKFNCRFSDMCIRHTLRYSIRFFPITVIENQWL